MSSVPESPDPFFREYIPKRFEGVKAGLAGKTSAGAMTFRVLDVGEWSLRLKNGELEVSVGPAEDVVLQVSVSAEDFKPIFVHGAELQEGEPLRPDQQILAFKVLTVDAERVKLVKSVPGNVAFVVRDGDRAHRVVVTPGSGAANLETPDCRLECLMSDFMDLQTGKRNPMELAMAGKIRIIGNAQLPIALSSVFV
jgi:putative sterol carrier protein